jgi:2-keto-3-deoxy-6-phosphogluconate aldolase
MNKKNQTLGRILKWGFLPNFINDSLSPIQLTEAAHEAGIRAVEISCRRPDTLEVLTTLKSKFPDMSFGVSSLIEEGPYYNFLQRRGPRFPSVREAAENGADFLVSMVAFKSETYRRHKHIPIIPGVETANEAIRHVDYGASLVKFSAPEARGGPAFFKSMLNCGPLHYGLPLLITGGMRPELIDRYVEAGMLVAVAGFDLILDKRYDEMQKRTDWKFVKSSLEKYVKAFQKARAKYMSNVNFASADPVIIQKQSGKFLNVTLPQNAQDDTRE